MNPLELWSRRSGVRVPSLTPCRAPLTRGFRFSGSRRPILARHRCLRRGGRARRRPRRCGGRLEDDDRGRLRSPRRVAVQLFVQFTPPLPQPLALRAGCRPGNDVASGATGEVDYGLRVRLQVQPPCRLGRGPAVHRHRNEVRSVFVVADDHAPRLTAAPAGRCHAHGSPLARSRPPEPAASARRAHDVPVHAPEGFDEPSRRQAPGLGAAHHVKDRASGPVRGSVFLPSSLRHPRGRA